MSRIIGAVVCGALFLAGCGGGAPAPGGAPGAPGGDFKATMAPAMKPCDDANKETKIALQSYKSGKMTLNEAKLVADAGVAACATARTAWRGMTMPGPVAEACRGEAEAKYGLAAAQRAALDHLLSKPYKSQIDRQLDAVTRAVAACKKAVTA
jgi:hypothetical protein